jgi:outer membrane protein OmpU
MNKFKKIGLTALATSLVASSAYAADVSVSGSAGMTFKTQGGNGSAAGDHGKGLGTDNSLSFSASGEMDNGWTVSASTAFTDKGAISSNAVTITMGSMGSISSGYSMAGNAGNYDGLGGAYEEVDDGAPTSLSTNQIGSTVDNAGIFYTSPTIDAAGGSVVVHLGYTPRATNANLSGGGSSGASTLGSATNAGITISHESGLKLGVFGNEINRLSTLGENSFEGTWYATYSMGPISLGYQTSYVNRGISGAADAAKTAKTVAAATGQFESDQYSITMNINDNLSVSYADADDEYDARSSHAAGSTTGKAAVADVTMSMKSIQAAYSMGSMSIKAYRQTTDNSGYDSGGLTNETTEIALGLSF